MVIQVSVRGRFSEQQMWKLGKCCKFMARWNQYKWAREVKGRRGIRRERTVFLHPSFPPLPTRLLPCSPAIPDPLTLFLPSHHALSLPLPLTVYGIIKALCSVHALRVSLALLHRCALRDPQCPPLSWSSWPLTAPPQATSTSRGSLSS